MTTERVMGCGDIHATFAPGHPGSGTSPLRVVRNPIAELAGQA